MLALALIGRNAFVTGIAPGRESLALFLALLRWIKESPSDSGFVGQPLYSLPVVSEKAELAQRG
jgi:hypothetical protein